jgi:L-ascorbate metabolism protein UlaG (beta-lactamase superfamily)
MPKPRPIPAVTLEWFGCATFRLTIGELVVFLDAYIDRVDGADGHGARAEDIDRADFILVGHSHFDHLWGAERIAPRTGATVIGSYETVRVMAAHGVAEAQLQPVSGGERVRLADGVTVRVFPSLHSCVWTGPFQQPDVVCIGDLGLTLDQQKARLGDIATHIAQLDPDGRAHLAAARQGERGDGGALVYLIDTPGGSLLYQDTSGHWSGLLRGLRPDVAILAAAGRGNIDGEPVQGTLAEFLVREVEFLRPRTVILGHHDNWLPGFSITTELAPVHAALAEATPATNLQELRHGEPVVLFPAR